jgi:hypothetical protein
VTLKVCQPSMHVILQTLQGHFFTLPTNRLSAWGARERQRPYRTIQRSVTLLDNIGSNAFKSFPCIIIYTSSLRGNGGLRRNHLCFSHGLDHPTSVTSHLVETRRPVLWNASGCCVWYLPSSPVYSICWYLGRNFSSLSAGNLWVRIYVLDMKTCLS